MCIMAVVKPKMVPRAGVEPAQRQTPRDFKSLVSTSSTTRAFEKFKKYISLIRCSGF